MAFPVFVSLTTVSSRLGDLACVLRSLQAQSRRPDRLILNISDEPFMIDRGVAFCDLPAEVRRAAMAGDIEIYRVANTGPYRKLVPTLRRFRGEAFLVATADDDVVYPERWLEGLCAAEANVGGIVAYRTREVRFHADGGARPYAEWPHSYELPQTAGVPGLHRVATGKGGVLYRSDFFADLELLERLRQAAPAQDDLGLRVATLLSGIPVTWIPYMEAEGPRKEFTGIHNADSLFALNSAASGGATPNDDALAALVAFCRVSGLSSPGLAPFLGRG